MGHVLLGELPRTRKWRQVIDLIGFGAGAGQIANQTVTAAEKGLMAAGNDKGVLETVWLLVQLPIAARSEDFAAALRDRGLRVSDDPGLMDIIAAFNESIDAKLPNCRGRTDWGEMSQMSGAEALAGIVGDRLPSLFEATSNDVQSELAKLGTVKQFGSLAKGFFARFLERSLRYFVDRATAAHVGEERRFGTLGDVAAFQDALRLHCQQASKIVEKFAGEWFAKHHWESRGEISRKEVDGFTSYAFAKLVTELKQGVSGNAD